MTNERAEDLESVLSADFEPELPDAARLPTSRATLQRAGWGIADQAIYGLTNITLSVFVARSVDPMAFGAFAVILIAYITSVGVVQSLTAEVFTVVYSAVPPADSKRALEAATGCALVLGLLGTLAAMSVSFLVEQSLQGPLRAFAVALPFLFLQDVWRYAFFAMGRPKAAVLNDMTWAVVQIALLLAITSSNRSTVPAFVLAWGCGAAAGAILGVVQARIRPRPLRSGRWLLDHGPLGWRFAGEFLTLYGAAQVAVISVGIAGGLAELARIRAAQVVFTPLSGLLAGMRLSVTSIAVRIGAHDLTRLWRFTMHLSAALGAVALGWGIAAVLLPDRLGRALLGESWPGAQAVILPLAATNIAAAIGLGALTALRALRAAHRSLHVRIAHACFVLVLGVAGAVTGGAVLAAVGIAIGNGVGACLLLWQARVAVRRATPTSTGERELAPDGRHDPGGIDSNLRGNVAREGASRS